MNNKELTLKDILEKYKDTPDIHQIVQDVTKLNHIEFDKTHKPIWEVKNFKDYTRHLIQLRNDIVMMIHLFKKEQRDNVEYHVYDFDNGEYDQYEYDLIKNSAHQLLLQLEGHYCDLFIECLRDECNEILKHSEEQKEKIKNKHENTNIK